MSLFELDASEFAWQIKEAGNNKGRVIEEYMSKIKKEISSTAASDTASGLLKLINVYICGYDITWATFAMISMTAQPKLQYKRIGYLGVSLVIHSNKVLISLVVNSITKDINSMNAQIVASAMDTLIYIIDESLAANIVEQVSSHIVSTRPEIKKRALVLLRKCIQKCPPLAQQYLPRIISCLIENNSNVKYIASSVVYDLHQTDHAIIQSIKSYLLKSFSDSSDNWLLIKILKILFHADLSNAEFKEMENRIMLICKGSCALSLLFESIRFATIKFSKTSKLVLECIELIRKYLGHSDPNLQYMALRILQEIVTIKRELVVSLKSEISILLRSNHQTIKNQAVDLFTQLVTKGNIKSIVSLMVNLMRSASDSVSCDSDFTNTTINKIVDMCSRDNYAFVPNFEWYIDTLLQLVVISIDSPKNTCGSLIAQELISIALRVHVMRPYLVTSLEKISNRIHESKLLSTPSFSALITNVVWICGEFSEYLSEPTVFLSDIQRNWVVCLNPEFQPTILHGMLKVASYILATTDPNISIPAINSTVEWYSEYAGGCTLYAHERALSYKCLLTIALEVYSAGKENVFENLRKIFRPELKMVSPDAQCKIAPPINIDLNEWFNKDILPKIPDLPPKHSNSKPRRTKPNRISSIESRANNLIEKKKDYPDINYEIAPIETGEEIQCRKDVLKLSHEPNSRPTKNPQKTNNKKQRRGSVLKKTQSDSALNLTIDSFLSNHYSEYFSSNFHESQDVDYSLSDALEKIRMKFNLKVLDKNDSAFLGAVMITGATLFILIRVENNNLELSCKSQSSRIPDEFSESIRDLLFS